MDIERFRQSPLGSLIPVNGVDGRTGDAYDHYGYAADPLGEPPILATETWQAVFDAGHALGRLEQGAALVPNPALLRRPTIRREAQSTSALEGTFAPIEDVLAADIVDEGSRSAALNEVVNYIIAAERAFDWVEEGRPITVGLICELHKTLVRGTAADNSEAGRIRRIPVAIGSRSGSIYDARFIPMPPGARLDTGFADLIEWAKTIPDSGNGIIRAAMAHYQFETLHPFNDGNGRLGRLLIVLHLSTAGLLSQSLLSVSPWFERRREDYQDHLAAVSATGDWDPWIRFFAEGIQSSALDTAERLRQLLALQQEIREQLRHSNARGVIRDIAELLVGVPYVTIPLLAERTGKTYPAVKTAVDRLLELKILEPTASSGVAKAFVARRVVDIMAQRFAG